MPTERIRDLYTLEQAGELRAPEQADLDALRQAGDLPPPGDPAQLFPADRPYAWFNAKAEAAHGLPPGLLDNIVHVESNGRPNAVSPTGVQGPYQITRRTGAAVGFDDSQRGNPMAEANAAATILADNLKTTNGDLRAAVNLYADPKDRAWYADRVLQNLPSSSTTSTPSTTPASFLDVAGQRATRDLAAGAQGVRALGRVAASTLVPPALQEATGTNPPNLTDATQALGVAAPLNIPADVTAGAGVERLTGSRGAGDLASFIASILPLGLSKLAAAARPLTPLGRLRSAATARLGEEVAGAGATAEAGAVAPRVVGAANRQVETLTKEAQRAQGVARQAAAKPGIGIRQGMADLAEAPAPTFDPITGRMIPPQVEGKFAPIEKVTQADVPAQAQGLLDRANRLSGEAVGHGQTTASLRALAPPQVVAAVRKVASDPDLAASLLAHATPEEATWIARAVTAGKTLARTEALGPIEAVPSSGLLRGVAKAARFVAMGGGYLHGGVPGAAVGYGVERTVETLSRTILNAALNSPKVNAIVVGLKTLDPGSQAFATQAARLGELVSRGADARKLGPRPR